MYFLITLCYITTRYSVYIYITTLYEYCCTRQDFLYSYMDACVGGYVFEYALVHVRLSLCVHQCVCIRMCARVHVCCT